jgi:hypothetical protein
MQRAPSKNFELKQALPLVDHFIMHQICRRLPILNSLAGHDVISPRYANVLLAYGKDYTSHWTQQSSTEVSIVKHVPGSSLSLARHKSPHKIYVKLRSKNISLTNFQYILTNKGAIKRKT